MGAVEWARKNNEVEAMRRVLTNIANSYNVNADMSIIADEIINAIFNF